MQLQFFPSKTMAFYMAKMFLLRSFAVLAMLVLVLQTLDLLGESGKILAHPGNGEPELWRYVGLRIPQIVDRFLPFSVLLGTLITLATLNQNSEVIAMKASGLSAHQVLAPLILSSVLVAGLSYAFDERIVVRANAALTAWEQVDYGPIPHDSGIKTNVWVRDGGHLIQAGTVQGRGENTLLTDIRVFTRSNNVLQSITKAPRARYSDGQWLIEDAVRFNVSTGTQERLGTLRVAPDVRPDQFTLSKVDPDALTFSELSSAISDLKDAGRPIASLEANLWHKISGPMSAVLMPLLGAVAAFGLARSGKLFIRAVIGMALGFAYFVADNFALAMGNLGAYPPVMAAWAPFFLFLLVGETVLVRTEE